MHKALHPRDDIDRLYMSRKEGRGHTTIEDSVAASIQGVEKYIKKELRKAYYSDQKHTDQQNNYKTEIGRKTTVWIFQATNKRTLT